MNNITPLKSMASHYVVFNPNTSKFSPPKLPKPPTSVPPIIKQEQLYTNTQSDNSLMIVAILAIGIVAYAVYESYKSENKNKNE